MKRKLFLIGALLSFLCGVFIADSWRDGWSILPGAVIIGLGFFPRISWRAVLYWSIFFLLGCWRIIFALPDFSAEDIAFYASEKESAQSVEIMGTVSSFPDMRSNQTKVYVAVEKIILPNGETKQVSGKILANLPKYPAVDYGDQLELSGTLEIPPVWEDFSYQRFLEKEGVYAYMPRAYFSVVEKNQGSPIFTFLFTLRSAVENTLRQRIPEPEASFAVGILLGGERGFSEKIIEEFRITGLSHLLALSGSNITILIVFVFWLCRLLPKYVNLMITLVFVTGFVLLTGAEASVVRAAVMGLISLFALHFGQEISALYVLLWSMFFMILWNPFLLVSDVGFQLSVAAVIGLILFTPVWQRMFRPVPEAIGLKDALQTTLAAQITAVPLVAFYFGRVSLISPVANLFVAPLIPFAMLLSFLSLFPFIGGLFAFGAYGVLHFGLWITHSLAEVPLADTEFSLGIIGLAVIYGLIAFVWWKAKNKNY